MVTPPFAINGETQVYGLLGWPVRASLSPAMHNAAFQALGINAAYVAFPTPPERLAEAVRGLAAAGIGGFNLTLPHKSAILPLLQRLEPQAAAIGAVNTVRCDAAGLSGTNTDGEGFLLSLRHDLGWDARGKRALLLGAGGAARGIAHSLLAAGVAELLIANRTAVRARTLAAECLARFPAARVTALDLSAAGGHAPHLLVNTTTVGMGDGQRPVDLAAMGVGEAVIDIVYHPLETPLLAQARALGLACTNGVGMLLYQGVAAFRYWTGREPPEAVMRRALEADLRARGQ
jgi:shikimate dehydrogenase